MIYEIDVTINNSPTKVKKWGFLINAETEIDAKLDALSNANIRANKAHSRYKKCSFQVLPEDCKSRPDW